MVGGGHLLVRGTECVFKNLTGSQNTAQWFVIFTDMTVKLWKVILTEPVLSLINFKVNSRNTVLQSNPPGMCTCMHHIPFNQIKLLYIRLHYLETAL